MPAEGHPDAQQGEEDRRRGEPADARRARPDPVGDPAGDEEPDDRADVEHEQEGQRRTEVVAGDPHDLRQPGVQPVDEQQTHERRHPDRDAVAQVAPGEEHLDQPWPRRGPARRSRGSVAVHRGGVRLELQAVARGDRLGLLAATVGQQVGADSGRWRSISGTSTRAGSAPRTNIARQPRCGMTRWRAPRSRRRRRGSRSSPSWSPGRRGGRG